MIIKNSRSWSPYSSIEALAWALGSFMLITVAMLSFGPNFYILHPYKFYFLASTILAYFFGFKTASIYVVLTSIYANLYFVAPFGEITLTGEEFERFLINLLFGSVAIIFIEILQRARFKSKLLLLVAESRYLILLHRDNQILNDLKRNK